jgi:hypothetical protein
MADFCLRLGAGAAVQLATAALQHQQLQAVRSFDLRDALQSQNNPCTCPHHGTTDCQCNYVVLLAYDMAASHNRAQPAGRIVIHSYDGTTWLSVPTPDEEPQVLANPHANRRLLHVIAEIMYEAAV